MFFLKYIAVIFFIVKCTNGSFLPLGNSLLGSGGGLAESSSYAQSSGNKAYAGGQSAAYSNGASRGVAGASSSALAQGGAGNAAAYSGAVTHGSGVAHGGAVAHSGAAASQNGAVAHSGTVAQTGAGKASGLSGLGGILAQASSANNVFNGLTSSLNVTSISSSLTDAFSNLPASLSSVTETISTSTSTLTSSFSDISSTFENFQDIASPLSQVVQSFSSISGSQTEILNQLPTQLEASISQFQKAIKSSGSPFGVSSILDTFTTSYINSLVDLSQASILAVDEYNTNTAETQQMIDDSTENVVSAINYVSNGVAVFNGFASKLTELSENLTFENNLKDLGNQALASYAMIQSSFLLISDVTLASVTSALSQTDYSTENLEVLTGAVDSALSGTSQFTSQITDSMTSINQLTNSVGGLGQITNQISSLSESMNSISSTLSSNLSGISNTFDVTQLTNIKQQFTEFLSVFDEQTENINIIGNYARTPSTPQQITASSISNKHVSQSSFVGVSKTVDQLTQSINSSVNILNQSFVTVNNGYSYFSSTTKTLLNVVQFISNSVSYSTNVYTDVTQYLDQSFASIIQTRNNFAATSGLPFYENASDSIENLQQSVNNLLLSTAQQKGVDSAVKILSKNVLSSLSIFSLEQQIISNLSSSASSFQSDIYDEAQKYLVQSVLALHTSLTLVQLSLATSVSVLQSSNVSVSQSYKTSVAAILEASSSVSQFTSQIIESYDSYYGSSASDQSLETVNFFDLGFSDIVTNFSSNIVKIVPSVEQYTSAFTSLTSSIQQSTSFTSNITSSLQNIQTVLT